MTRTTAWLWVAAGVALTGCFDFNADLQAFISSHRQLSAQFVVQPQSTAVSVPFGQAIQVRLVDAANEAVTDVPKTLVLSIGGGAVLSGTLSAPTIAGVATFPSVSVDQPGTGYTLTATADGVTPGVSAPFDITGSAWASIGPAGGRVFSLVIDPLNTEDLYSTVVSTLSASTTGGGSWTLTNPQFNVPTGLLFADPNSGTIYSGNGLTSLSVIVDGGYGWQSVLGLDLNDLTAMAFSNSGTLYAFGEAVGSPTNTAYSSYDGVVWTSLGASLPADFLPYGSANDPWSADAVYVGGTSAGSNVVYHVVDGGTQVTLDYSSDGGGGLYLVSSSDSVLGYTSGQQFFWKTPDGGWQAEQAPPSALPAGALIDSASDPSTSYLAIDNQIWRTQGDAGWLPIGQVGFTAITCLASDPGGLTLYAGSGSGIYKSLNGGVNWELSSTGMNQQSVVDMVVTHQTPASIYLITDEGEVFTALTTSADTGAWTNLGRVEQEQGAAHGIAVDSANNVYASGDLGVFISDGGSDWQALPDPQYGTSAIVADPTQNGALYVIHDMVSVYKTGNGGGSWIEADDGLPAPDAGYFLQALALDPNNPSVLYAGTGLRDGSPASGVVFKTFNGGTSWSPLNCCDTAINQIMVDPVDSRNLYVATNGGGVWRSLDGGAGWDNVYPGVIWVLAIDPEQNHTVYLGEPSLDVAGLGNVFKSIDQGSSWVSASAALPSRPTRLIVDPAQSNNVFAGTDQGSVLFTHSGGQ